MPVRICQNCRQEVPARDWQEHQRRHARDRRNARSPAWPKTRAKVLARDGHRCTVCGATEKLAVHHLDGDPTNDRLENLATRCPEHHPGVGAKDGPPPWWWKETPRPSKPPKQPRRPPGPMRLS